MPAELHFLQYLNHAFQGSWTVSTLMLLLTDNDFLKGAVLVLFWWVWFRTRPADIRAREILISTLPAAFVAFFVGRVCANLLPFRVRPFANPELHWHTPEGFDSSLFLRHWSSFPSDHAACFAAVIFPLLLVAPRVGIIGLIYTLLVIDLPRVYLGLHYPTDILGGIVVGFAVAAFFAARPVSSRLGSLGLNLMERRPGLFYAGVFLCIFAVGSINAVHDIVNTGTESVKAWGHHHSSKHVFTAKLER